MNQGCSTWATVEVTVTADRNAELGSVLDRLQEIGALLAMHAAVDGVQTLDPSYEADRPTGLCIYTRPEALEAVEQRARELLDAHALAAEYLSAAHDDESWRDAWKAHYQPLRFGNNQLLIRPSWIARQPDDPDLEIVLDPGRAFGTGLHPTTQLCIERMCELVREGFTPTRALDLGCGSGILALAAIRLFPSLHDLLAIDNDPEATETASENATLNAMLDRLTLRTATLEDIETSPRDLIVANIRPVVLIPLAHRLQAHLAPQGALTVSGILPEESPSVEQAYLDAGWILARPIREQDGWSSLDFVLPPSTP